MERVLSIQGQSLSKQDKEQGGLLSHWSELLARGSREGAMIGLFFLSVYLFLSLLTHNDADPGWTTLGASSGRSISNAGGPVGAWCADVLLSLFGILAYMAPALIGYRGWLIFRSPAGRRGAVWSLVVLRGAGWALTMAGAAGLAFLHVVVPADVVPQVDSLGRNPAGGIVGIQLGGYCMDTVGQLGATLILLGVALTGLTVFADISWIKIMDRLGGLGVSVIGWLYEQRPRVSLPTPSFRRLKTEPQADTAAPVIIPVLDEVDPLFQPSTGRKKLPTAAKPAKRKEHAVVGAPTVELVLPPPEPLEPSVRALKEKQRSLFDEGGVEGVLPPLHLLDVIDKSKRKGYSSETLESMSRLLETKLRDFGIEATVENVLPGPVVTRFEIQPAPGIKVSRISNLAKDLARSLAVISVRVVEVIPGKTFVGIEIPNEVRETIRLSEILSSDEYDKNPSPLTLALGKDISGRPICADLARMPHLLVAGTTGSGKSVGVNAMLLSMLFKAGPADLRLIMIDPKMLELSVYDGIPHLLTPVVTDMKEAANALRWCVGEMERRYRLMAAMGVRNLAGYNRKIKDADARGEPIKDPFFKPVIDGDKPPDLTTLPFVVVVIDEFADMMMIVGKKVEELIARIAQKARAAGIHLLLATQRPSVDVITGLIKANIPTRMAFQVSSKIDSRTILDQGGAEQLLGQGDMLYLPPGSGIPVRVHGAFVDDDEVHRVCNDWRKRGEPDYLEEILEGGGSEAGGFSMSGEDGGEGGEGDMESDALYDEALRFVTETRRASISSVQRKFKIGYNRAARLIEAMEHAGVVSSMQTNGSREVIAPPPVHLD